MIRLLLLLYLSQRYTMLPDRKLRQYRIFLEKKNIQSRGFMPIHYVAQELGPVFTFLLLRLQIRMTSIVITAAVVY